MLVRNSIFTSCQPVYADIPVYIRTISFVNGTFSIYDTVLHDKYAGYQNKSFSRGNRSTHGLSKQKSSKEQERNSTNPLDPPELWTCERRVPAPSQTVVSVVRVLRSARCTYNTSVPRARSDQEMDSRCMDVGQV